MMCTGMRAPTLARSLRLTGPSACLRLWVRAYVHTYSGPIYRLSHFVVFFEDNEGKKKEVNGFFHGTGKDSWVRLSECLLSLRSPQNTQVMRFTCFGQR